MKKSYEIGFNNGNNFGGTNNYKPTNRKVGDKSRADYDAGFQAGMSAHHEATRLQRQQLARLNQPKLTRGSRPEARPFAGRLSTETAANRKGSK